ncbi:response regulator transcription factor [Pedobacter foliorum]|uniref:response regulator n=1 Tax=Pedobacter foliorum TaxID=2739058 RepID=UPI001564CAB1|nr:response regulator transcription factor [Pedobacter foliorum]NRF40098.1 response regulator transcription factor [Pedobacter foliorum]
MIKVLVYEDNNSLRQTLQLLIAQDDSLWLVGAHSNCNSIKINIEDGIKPDVILMDIDMPGIGGIEGVKIAKSIIPDVQVIIFTVYEDDEKLFRCLMAGANGYLLKKNSASQIVAAIKDVYGGGVPMNPEIARKVMRLFKEEKATITHNLSDREVELLAMLSQGLPYKIIAIQTGISVETVKTHLKNIYQKMHVANGTEAVGKGLRMRIIR